MIEVDMKGSVDQYLVQFGINSPYKEQSGFVCPIIVLPTGNLRYGTVFALV